MTSVWGYGGQMQLQGQYLGVPCAQGGKQQPSTEVILMVGECERPERPMSDDQQAANSAPSPSVSLKPIEFAGETPPRKSQIEELLFFVFGNRIHSLEKAAFLLLESAY